MAKYLIDTNIFLEILLAQSKSNECKSLLKKHIGSLFISDFTLHSIGVILFKFNQHQQFKIFLNDLLPNAELVTLAPADYNEVGEISLRYKLDFDDAYQTAVARSLNLTVKTIDKDFKKVSSLIDVEFIK